MNAAPTLLALLEVDASRLPRRCEQTVQYCQRRWEEHGRPSSADALRDWLDRTLKFCPGVGYLYPKIFLLRLKQLQRGEWTPLG